MEITGAMDLMERGKTRRVSLRRSVVSPCCWLCTGTEPSSGPFVASFRGDALAKEQPIRVTLGGESTIFGFTQGHLRLTNMGKCVNCGSLSSALPKIDEPTEGRSSRSENVNALWTNEEEVKAML